MQLLNFVKDAQLTLDINIIYDVVEFTSIKILLLMNYSLTGVVHS